MAKKRATSKPQIKSFIALQEKRDLIAKLSEELREESVSFVEKYGEGRFDFPIEEVDGYSFVKYEITDNIRKVNEGEAVISVTFFKPVEIKQTFLKRMPESLKGSK